MGLIAVRCPKCNGDIELDAKKKWGFCLYCGTKIMVEDVAKKVKIDKSEDIDNYLALAMEAEKNKNYSECEKYCIKILEIDCNNVDAWLLRGVAAGWQSTNVQLRIIETINAFKKVVNYIQDKNDSDKYEKMYSELMNISKAIIKNIADQLEDFFALSNANLYKDIIKTVLSEVNSFLNAISSSLDKYNYNELNTYANNIGYRMISSIYNNIKSAFGVTCEQQNSNLWKKYVEVGTISLSLLDFHVSISSTIEECEKFKQLYITINNEISTSCSYKYNYQTRSYMVELSFTPQAKQVSINNNMMINQKATNRKIQVQQEDIQRKKQFYKNFPEEYKKDLEEHNNNIESLNIQIQTKAKEVNDIALDISDLKKKLDETGITKIKEKKEIKKELKEKENLLSNYQNDLANLRSLISVEKIFLENYGSLN